MTTLSYKTDTSIRWCHLELFADLTLEYAAPMHAVCDTSRCS